MNTDDLEDLLDRESDDEHHINGNTQPTTNGIGAFGDLGGMGGPREGGMGMGMGMGGMGEMGGMRGMGMGGGMGGMGGFGGMGGMGLGGMGGMGFGGLGRGFGDMGFGGHDHHHHGGMNDFMKGPGSSEDDLLSIARKINSENEK